MRVLHEASRRPVFRVLFVDDDGRDAELMEHALDMGDGHFHTLYSGDPEEALAYLRGEPPFEDAERPHLIITDLNMPKMDGLEFLREARRSHLEDNPIVILSHSSNPHDVREAYNLGASLYIVKPHDLSELAEAIRKVQILYLEVVTVNNDDGSVRAPTRPGAARPPT